MDLPPWALDSKREALKEMKAAHVRWKKRKKVAKEGAMKSRYETEGGVEDTVEEGVRVVDGTRKGMGMGTEQLDASIAIMREGWQSSSSYIRNDHGEKGSRGDKGGYQDGSRSNRSASQERRSSRIPGSLSPLRSSRSAGQESFRSPLPGQGDRFNGRSYRSRDQSQEKRCKDRDEFLDIGNNVVMTFRVVLGEGQRLERKTKEKNDSLRYKSLLEMRGNNLESLHDSSEKSSRIK
jgi:hypothetical protein